MIYCLDVGLFSRHVRKSNNFCPRARTQETGSGGTLVQKELGCFSR